MQGAGSFVIITTRDEKALDKLGCICKHRVARLSPPCAYDLFIASARGKPIDVEENLVQEIIIHCSGLPLSLKVST
jgi:hypothetical protein